MKNSIQKQHIILLGILSLICFFVLLNSFFVRSTDAVSGANFSSGDWNATSTWTGISLLGSIAAPTSANYGTYDGSNFWIANFGGDLYKVSNDVGTLTTYHLGGSIHPVQMAWDGTYIWVGSGTQFGELLQFDPVSETVLNTYQMNPTGLGNGGIQGVLWDGTNLWLGIAQEGAGPGSGLVLKVDPANGNIIGTSTGQFNVNGLVDDGAYIWAANDGFVSKINKADMTYATTSSGGATYRLATDGTYIYGASYAEGNVRKFLASDMSLVDTWPSGSNLNTIAYDGNYIWVAGDSNRITVHDKNTGAIVYSRANASKSDLVFDGTYMWGNLIGTVNKFTINSPFSNGWPIISEDATISTGTVTLVRDESVHNLSISGGTLNLNGHTLSVDGNVTIGGGTLDFASLSSSIMNVNGNWTYASGTVLSTGGTVNLISTSTQTIFGANSFYNLTKSAATTSILLFDAFGTTTVTHNLSLSGTLGNILSIAPTQSSSSFQALSSVGDTNNPPGFSSPRATVSSLGDIYVLDAAHNRVAILNPDGSASTTAPTISLGAISGAGNNIAVGPTGKIYVTVGSSIQGVLEIDPGSSSVSNTYTNLSPLSPSSFNGPIGIAVAQSGYIYVADQSNHRIVILNPDGTASTSIALGGSVYPNGLAISPHNEIYVTDFINVNIKIFNANNTASTTITIVDSSIYPENIAINQAGRMYINDRNNIAIQILNPDGTTSSTIPLDQNFSDPASITLKSNGDIYIGDAGLEVINLFNTAGTLLETYNYQSQGSFNNPYGVVFDSTGDFYVSDANIGNIQKFDSSGNFLSFVHTVGAGSLSSPSQLAVDASDNLYVGDHGNNRVVKFDSSGNYLDEVAINTPSGITLDTDGNLYVADNSDNTVTKFDSNLSYVGSVSSANSISFNIGDGLLSMDPSGTALWLADSNNARLVKLNTSNLSYISSFSGSGLGALNSPIHIAFNSGDTIFVDNENTGAVLAYDSNFTFLAKLGSGNNQFNRARQMSMSASGIIYIADKFNNIVRRFQTVLPFNLISSGSSNFSYLSVANSYNHSTAFDCTNNCTDRGGNTNWTFVAVVPPPAPGASGGGAATVIPPTPPAATSTPMATSTATSTPPMSTTTTPVATTTSPIVPIVPATPPVTPTTPTSPTPSQIIPQVPSLPSVITPITSTPTVNSNSSAQSGIPAQSVPMSTLASNIVENIKQSYVQTAIVVAVAVQKVGAVVQSPTGSVVTKVISTTGVVTSAVVSASLVAFSTPITFSEIWLIPTRLFGLLVGALGIRRKNRPWGTVYDSVTKRPLDPAYVSLIDAATGKVLSTAITDLDGRYSFLVTPGKYKILAQKTNYVPSTKMEGKVFDEVYNNLYFGTDITIEHEGEVITKNIPMDSQNFDWNEFTKNKMNINTFVKGKDVTWARVSKSIFALGGIVSVIALIFAPAPYNFMIAGLYIVAYMFNYFIFKTKTAGALIDKATHMPLSFALVKIYREGQDTPIATRIADAYGKYYALLPNDTYSVTIEKKEDSGTYTQILKTTLDITKGILNQDWEV